MTIKGVGFNSLLDSQLRRHARGDRRKLSAKKLKVIVPAGAGSGADHGDEQPPRPRTVSSASPFTPDALDGGPRSAGRRGGAAANTRRAFSCR